nr:family 1 glycosylhydrolase [Evansella caseinilytica]
MTLFNRYGEQVLYLISLNEQNYFVNYGYETGLHPPGVKGRKRMYEANHLAKAKVIQLFAR